MNDAVKAVATLAGGATATTGVGLMCPWATTAADMVNAADGADAESDPTGFDPITVFGMGTIPSFIGRPSTDQGITT